MHNFLTICLIGSFVVDEDIFDVVTSEYTHSLGWDSHRDENNSLFWRLHPGSYRVYGLTVSIELVTPRSSSTRTVQTALPRDVKVKLKPGLKTPIVENIRFHSKIIFFSDEEVSPTKPPPQVIVGGDASKVYPLS